MYCKCHELNFECGGSYIDSPGWIKNKTVTKNLRNTHDKYFQYVATFALQKT